MRLTKNAITIGVLACLIILVGGMMYHRLQEMSFSDIIQTQADQIIRVEVQGNNSDGAGIIVLDDKTANTAINFLNRQKFKYKETASVLQGGYARLFINTKDGSEIELLLSPEEALVNFLNPEKRSQLYRIMSDGRLLEEYILSLKKS